MQHLEATIMARETTVHLKNLVHCAKLNALYQTTVNINVWTVQRCHGHYTDITRKQVQGDAFEKLLRKL